MSFVSTTEVNKTFKKESGQFKKGYFQGHNNPKTSAESLKRVQNKLDELAISGKMTPAISDYYRGLRIGIEDRSQS